MSKVFIGGSRHVTRLNADIKKRLDTIIAKALPIVVGDANGADKAVQKYLHGKNYGRVEVFCTEDVCRNNVGGWVTHTVPAATRERNAEFHSAKDRVMAKEATVGLMIWDGKSVGTLLNVYRLLHERKKAVIYTVPLKQFQEIHAVTEWGDFMAACDGTVRAKVEQRARSEASRPRTPSPSGQTALPL